MDNKKCLTVAEVAAEFGVDETALQGFVDSGEVRALADRGTWKYRRDELQALLDAGKVAPPNDEIWLDDASSNDEILNVGADSDDELSYIELDEDALAEHATMITKKSCSPAMISPTVSHTSVTDVAQAANEFLYCLLDRLLDGCASEGDLAVLIVKDDVPLVAVLDGLRESVASLCCKNLQLLEH